MKRALMLLAAVELAERRIEGDAPRRTGRERGRAVLTLGQEGLARELRDPFEVRGSRGVRGGIGH